MRGPLALVLALLLSATLLVGQSYNVPFNPQPAAAGSYGDITFWLGFEANGPDSTSPYTMGAGDCSDGDTTGVYSGTPTTDTTSAKIGTYGFHTDGSGSTERMEFAVSSNDIVDMQDTGRIGFWLNKDDGTIASDQTFFSVLNATAYLFSIRGRSGNQIKMIWNNTTTACGASAECEALCTNNTIDVDTWYFVEVAWSVPDDTIWFWIDGVACSDSPMTTDAGFTGAAATRLFFGPYSSATIDWWWDNMIITTDETRDLYGSGTGLSDDTSPPSGSCDG